MRQFLPPGIRFSLIGREDFGLDIFLRFPIIWLFDYSTLALFCGQSVGLIHDLPAAREFLDLLAAEASKVWENLGIRSKIKD